MAGDWQVVGHSWAVDFLKRSVATNRLAHAYLLLGPPQIGRRTLAVELARALNCTASEGQRPCGECLACRKIAHATHPDVRVIEPEGGALKIGQIRDLQRETNLTPHEGRYRVAVLQDFDLATVEAANCLLKTLEEPPPQVVLCLTAQDESQLLPTIVSRCQALHLHPLPQRDVERALTERWATPPESAALLARLSAGRLGWAVEVSQDSDMLESRERQLDALVRLLGSSRVPRFKYAEGASADPPTATQLLEVWLSWWRDVLLTREGNSQHAVNVDRVEEIVAYADQLPLRAIHSAISSIRSTQQRLDSNANLRLALEVLLLSLPSVNASV